MSRTNYLLRRAIAIVALVVGGIGMDSSITGWSYWWHLAIFLAGLEFLIDAVERYTKRKLMPYLWQYPICKNKGKKVKVESTAEDFVSAFRNSHNRDVHFMEP